MPCEWEAEEMSTCNVNHTQVYKISTQIVLCLQGIQKHMTRKSLQQLGR